MEPVHIPTENLQDVLLTPPVTIVILKRDGCPNCMSTLQQLLELPHVFNAGIYMADFDGVRDALGAFEENVQRIINEAISAGPMLPVVIRVSHAGRVSNYNGAFDSTLALQNFITHGTPRSALSEPRRAVPRRA
jgi:hypothetical protein